MCGIAGIINLDNHSIKNLEQKLAVMNKLLVHRGPDGVGYWWNERKTIGFSHNRLSIIDIPTGKQPMISPSGNAIIFNGEIYNYPELRKKLNAGSFRTNSDTEVILKAYEKWGENCLDYFRGMFAFAIFDKSKNALFCARDRFGIKPFYYTLTKEGEFVFASEAKAILPFLHDIETDLGALKEYFVFQFLLGDKTLFKGIKQLSPAHTLTIRNKTIRVRKYWEVHYTLDWHHKQQYFQNKVRELLEDSVGIHLRSDVPVGAYLSGGLDSSIVTTLARKVKNKEEFKVFTGAFEKDRKYNELFYAKEVAVKNNLALYKQNITADDFIDNIEKVIYYLDYPVGGPGSFPQFLVSRLAGKYVKVVLGGQGGDEVFGGYARYLLAYFEQCIKGAIEGTMHKGKFIVTYESIIPSLSVLNDYKPLMQEFWSGGLFQERDQRYLRLINRANNLAQEVNWKLLDSYSVTEKFKEIYWGENVEKESYFDSMTHFDFKTLLPSLLQVEDRMSMAHGLESRVPILDHPLVEFAATIPSNIKFANGQLKHLLRSTFAQILPQKILQRKDKMGFPVPLSEWLNDKKFYDFVYETLNSKKAKSRPYLKKGLDVKKLLSGESRFGRKVWGLLSLELWQEQFHDKIHAYRRLLL